MSGGPTIIPDDVVRLVLEKTKLALIEAQEFVPHAEKLKAFDVSANMPEITLLFEESEYDGEFHAIEDYLSKRPDFKRKIVHEKYASDVDETDDRNSGGATWNIVNESKGTHERVIMLRQPFDLSVLVHEILHIFEEYLGLQYGHLATLSQSVTQCLDIKVLKRETKGSG